MTECLFGSVVTAMVTPFTEAGQVNYSLAEKLASYLIENGSDSVLVCGTTGESPTLTRDEEYELFAVVKNVIGNKGKVIAGTGSNSTKEAIEATEKAVELGLDGSLQVVPYYNKPPQSGLFKHFESVAKAVPDLPIMLYNIPGRTGCNLLPETVIKLAEINNIVAIKEASGSLDQACQIRCSTDSSFAIYSGDDFLTLPLLTMGGTGIISVASHIVGKEIKQMVTAFKSGNTKLAVELQLKLYPLFKALFCTTNPIPVKAALKMRGWEVGGLRLPLDELPSNLEDHLANVLKQLDLL